MLWLLVSGEQCWTTFSSSALWTVLLEVFSAATFMALHDIPVAVLGVAFPSEAFA